MADHHDKSERKLEVELSKYEDVYEILEPELTSYAIGEVTEDFALPIVCKSYKTLLKVLCRENAPRIVTILVGGVLAGAFESEGIFLVTVCLVAAWEATLRWLPGQKKIGPTRAVKGREDLRKKVCRKHIKEPP